MAPPKPNAERRDQLIAILGDLVARGGPGPFLADPIEPGNAAFPEPWKRTRGATVGVLRRLAWHVKNPRAIVVDDGRLGAPPTDRRPETRVGLQAVEAKSLQFRIEFLGEDDIAGTLAHELGVAHAAIHRPAADPYREADAPRIDVDADRDHERGSVAAVYLGLGALVANAAFQEYNRPGKFNGVYYENEHDVLRAGYISLSDIAFLVAVQATIRGAGIPNGLKGPQKDEVSAWMTELAPKREALRENLGIAPAAEPDVREVPVPFDDIDVDEDAPPPRKTAFRWRTHRGGVGLVVGTALGIAVAMGAMATANVWLAIVFGGSLVGHLAGRKVVTPRCSACATVVLRDATKCRHCGAALRGDIDSLSERLEAEERLVEDGTRSESTRSESTGSESTGSESTRSESTRSESN
ncbi:MAG: hypothetical protein ACKV2T_02655 [Kofleriaceae bacterium]